jgi:hypothetical protein
MKLKDMGDISSERADNPINRTGDTSGSMKDIGFFKRLFGIFSL